MDVEERLAELERRLQQLDDEAAVRRVLAAYGPLVDAGDAEGAAGLWESDGVYDVDELIMRGRGDIATMITSSVHQGFIAGGCAHLIGPPHVTVTGDDATAIGHSLLVLRRDGTFVVHRATANHWRLRRGSQGWRVVVRTSRILDGRPESPALLVRDQPTP